MHKEDRWRIDVAPPASTRIVRGELRLSLFLAWLVVSLVLATMVVLPLVASEGLINAVTPECLWRTQFGRECMAALSLIRCSGCTPSVSA